ncbi:MAG: phosphoribosyltransferase [Cyanobacteria bacterium SZAS-4]|nr:phosphoribosyltransferase [Cyanobacteria bacterium SZAS-4]
MFYSLTSLRALIIDADDFGGRPQIITDIIKMLGQSIEVALVTRRNWIARVPPVRTFHPIDMTEHLDSKILLTRAIKELKVPPCSTVYLCSSTVTLELTKDLLLGSVVFPNQPLSDIEKHLLYQESPDFVVDSLDALYKCLSILDTGYAAEVASSPDRLVKANFGHSTTFSPTVSITPNPKDSTASLYSSSAKPTTRVVKLPNLQHPECPYFVLGRYFGPSDPRHALHALSLRLSHFKHHHSPHSQLFANLFLRGIEAATGGVFDLITQVPSRPEVGDRLAHILRIMHSNLSKQTQPADSPHARTSPTSIQSDILRCVNSYPPLKGLNLKARKASVAKVFQVQKDIQGKRIVLIDDIVTTGATINACITELKSAGAASVTAVLLAYHPYGLKARPSKSINICTECGERLGITFDSSELYFECLKQTGDDSHSKVSFNNAFSEQFQKI